MRCAIYARFSSDRQKDTSVDDQLRDCRRFAEGKGWDVVAEYSDARISGAKNRRPGLMALLADLAERRFDTILVEHQDRLARDLEDIAGVYKRVRFHDARIVTLARGELRQLDIGVQGAMDAEDLQKIADRVRRGQRGAVARGHIPAGRAYGYRIVRRIDDRGELVKGLREIDPEEAAIVVRIFADYAAGRSPLDICRRLNEEGVPSPRGGEWAKSALVGNASRRTGILHNPLYAGQLVFNRTRWVRDPDTRNRRPRANEAAAHETRAMPELRIVPEQLWDEVQAALRARAGKPLGDRRRPKHLLSGLLECGACGGSYAVVNRDRLGCSGRNNGRSCANARTIARDELQRRVLAGLERKLLSADAVSLLVAEYHRERARTAGADARRCQAREERLRKAEAAVERLVAAIAEGGESFADLRDALSARTAERDALRLETAGHAAEAEAGSVIALHPRIADRYRERVAAIVAGLHTGELTAESSAGQIRALINRVVIGPAEGKGCSVEVVCSLEAAVDLATGGRNKGGSKCTAVVVAGVGFEPTTFRL